METPRTREELIDTHLTDSDIAELISHLKDRVSKYGDVAAAKLLVEFKYGRNPEPPNNNQTLEDLFLATPLSGEALSSE